MKLQRTYRFRMKPTNFQQQSLGRFAGARRWAWNWALARRKEYYEKHGKGISYLQLSAELTALKDASETAWLREVDSQLLQQVLRDLDSAFKSFFEHRAKFPRFKSKKVDRARFRIPQRVKITGGKVYVPKVGWIRIRQSQQIEGETKSATFKQDARGNWYVTLISQFEMSDIPLPIPNQGKVIGIDVGLKDFAVLSTKERVDPPKFYRRDERRLGKIQRRYSRTKKGSKRRQKARIRVAKIYEKIKNRRTDFLHKLSTNLVKRFDGICVEDLNVKGLARTKLAKSFLDAAHGEFRRQLQYKCLWNRKHFVAIDRFFPSSKMCRSCGEINENLTLADRVWICPGCGKKRDRDLNAARNIKREGLRILAVGHADRLNARGGNVRLSHRKAIPVEARIPRL